MEPYLYLVKRPRFRNAIARFRCSFHTFEIERGRHTNPKTPVADRVCVHCKVMEDDKHFLLNCDINAFGKQCFFEKISESFDEFIYLNNDEKFPFVLNKCEFTLFILFRWISLSVVWKRNEFAICRQLIEAEMFYLFVLLLCIYLYLITVLLHACTCQKWQNKDGQSTNLSYDNAPVTSFAKKS